MLEKRYHPIILVLLLLISTIPANYIEATPKVKLSNKKLSIRVGEQKILKLHNNKKKVSWTVISGKKSIQLKNKKKTSVKIVAKKKGTAKVQAKVGKKKYICTITVKPVDYSEKEAEIANIESESIDLYAINPKYSKLSIPATYMQKYQIPSIATTNCYSLIVSGDSVTISNTGLITPKAVTYYWNGNVGSTVSSGKEGETTTVKYNFGTTVFDVFINGKRHRYSVTVHDYAEVYADKVMNEYLSQHISRSMTETEKMKKIAEFPCQYDYSPKESSAMGMIINGGGDCWASTGAILELCMKAGLKARVRDARRDPGAGSGHMNDIVKADGKLYIVDAGYNESAPRYYSIKEVSEYNYTVNSDNTSITITGYNGVDTKVNIPQVLDGYLVTIIGTGAFCTQDEIRDITIPNSVEIIEDMAFEQTALQAVKVPDSVVKIGENAFSLILDYRGPHGSFGFGATTEMVDLSQNVKTLGVDLSKSIVLYRGTKEQWNKINFTSCFKAPEVNKIFYGTEGLELSSTNVTVECNKSKEIELYTLDSDVSIQNSDPSISHISMENKVREYNYYRDRSDDKVVDKIKTITIKGLKEGKSVLKFTNGEGAVKEVNVTVKEVPKKQTEVEPKKTTVQKPLKIKNVKVKKLAGKKLKVSFSKGSNVKGYQVQYATRKNFKTKKEKHVTKNQITLKKLKSKTYYVRVRAYRKSDGKKVYGKWSSVKKVKVKKC